MSASAISPIDKSLAGYREKGGAVRGLFGRAGTANANREASRDEHRGRHPARRVKNYSAGGAEEDRTPDLVIANDALSQLSYSPVQRMGAFIGRRGFLSRRRFAEIRVRRHRAGARRKAALAGFACNGYMSATIGDRHARPHSDNRHGA